MVVGGEVGLHKDDGTGMAKRNMTWIMSSKRRFCVMD
jgi:hypothetical protein